MPNQPLQRTGGLEGQPSWEGFTGHPPLNSTFGAGGPTVARRRQVCLWLTATLLLAVGVAWTWDKVRKTQALHERMRFNQELLCVALAYHRFAENHGFPPRGLADIEVAQHTFPRVYEMMRGGEFVLRWNARLTANGRENDQYVLGYESKVPSEGGWVLMGGGDRRQVTADEFQELPLIPNK
jgi:hypothetical protein